jgi:hypothetical protein
MAAAGIHVKLIAGAFFLCSLFLTAEVRGQERAVPKQLLEGLQDIDLEPVQIAADSFNVLVIVSERNCSHCYQDLCEIFAKDPKWKGAKISALVLQPYSASAVLTTAANTEKMFPCGSAVYFKFEGDALYKEMSGSPSPQLIVTKQSAITYVPYGKTIKMLNQP